MKRKDQIRKGSCIPEEKKSYLVYRGQNSKNYKIGGVKFRILK
jgi:hypothetical protein